MVRRLTILARLEKINDPARPLSLQSQRLYLVLSELHMDGQWAKRALWWRMLCGRSADGAVRFGHGFHPLESFRQKLIQERKRAERAGKPLLVMVVTAGGGLDDDAAAFLARLATGLPGCLRETDICGALEGRAAGAILVEVAADKVKEAERCVGNKVSGMLRSCFGEEVASRMVVTFRLYPETGGDGAAFDLLFFPEVTASTMAKAPGALVKRALDLVGSLAALLLLSPVFVLVPIAIRLGSEGPVLFVQERYGLNGARFKLLKFRSMHVNRDDAIHREFVKELIEGRIDAGEETVYKITSDPRVTGVGRFLRAYSLDELPQLFNVLKGDMSLVGPRPPIHYEVESYRGWQRNRLIGKKPGITGAWQVSGRSSTNFDDMVRLDLRYLRNWSVLLDLKILLITPVAVLRCRGAY